MMIYFGILFAVMAVCAGIAHYFGYAINSSLIVAREPDIFKRACQFDKTFVNNSAIYLSRVHRLIIAWLCPVLLMSIVMVCTDAIIFFKGQSLQYLHVIVSVLFAGSLIGTINLYKVFNVANAFGAYMVIAYYINEINNVVRLWEHFIDNTSEEEFAHPANIQRLQQILSRHTFCAKRLYEFYNATDNEIIQAQIKQHTKPLFTIQDS